MGEGGDLLLVGEVAAVCRTSVSTVRFWIQAGKLPSLRPGRRRLVRRADLERFLEQSGQPAGHGGKEDGR
jgi:excisionase family DNA binding protein